MVSHDQRVAYVFMQANSSAEPERITRYIDSRTANHTWNAEWWFAEFRKDKNYTIFVSGFLIEIQKKMTPLFVLTPSTVIYHYSETASPPPSADHPIAASLTLTDQEGTLRLGAVLYSSIRIIYVWVLGDSTILNEPLSCEI